jgi:3-phenylpropionate/trans-cinnamate dioxygenase ferredoxin subunit
MAQYIAVATTEEIRKGTFKSVEINFDRILIVHNDDGFFAIADECSHDSAPFSEGRLDGHDIVCVRHGARFDIKTGAVTGPPAVVPIDTYELKIEGSNILVRVDE